MKLEREKKRVLRKQIPTPTSITCGAENNASLGCQFYELEGGEMATFFTARKVHEGHVGIMHGGLSGSVLDELMGRSTLSYCDENQEDWIPRYMTAEMTVKYKKPIRTGQTIYGFGRVERKEGRCCFTSSELVNEDMEIVAMATGVFVEVKTPKAELPEYVERGKNRQKISENDPKVL